MQSTLYLIVFLITGGLIICAAALSGRKTKSDEDFSLAGRDLSATGVSWVIIGTLVGGASTIGTVQMAYSYGYAAWYFTLGSGIACLCLALFFAAPLREAEVTTVAEYLGRTFGANYRLYSSALTSLGMFVHIIAQFIAAKAILDAVIGGSLWFSLLLVFLLHLVIVVLGGMKGAAWLGRAKCVLLYALLLSCAALALSKAGGYAALKASLPAGNYGFWAYGKRKGAIDLFSVVIGVLSTQTYLQALFSARDVKSARNGALLSAVLIPPIGLLGIIVGLYLRNSHTFTTHSAKALPYFINTYFGEFLAAVSTAILLVVVLGTGAGLSLGVTTNIFNDFFKETKRNDAIRLQQIRLCSVLVLFLALVIVYWGLQSAILEWSYLSMGIRGSAVLAGLMLVVFLPKHCPWPPFRWFLYLLPILYGLLKVL